MKARFAGPVLFLLLLMATLHSSGDELSPLADVILIVDASHSMNVTQFADLVAMLRQIPDFCTMSMQYGLRVIVTAFSNRNSIIELDWTAEAEAVRTLNVLHRPSGFTYTSEALKHALDVSRFMRTQAMQVVVLITGIPRNQDETERVAASIRNQSIKLWPVFFDNMYDKIQMKHHLDEVAGGAQNVIRLSNTSNLAQKFCERFRKPKFTNVTCLYNETCRYADSEQRDCVAEVWGDSQLECAGAPKPKPSLNCTDQDCKDGCADVWDYPNPCVNKNLRGLIRSDRVSKVPPNDERMRVHVNCKNNEHYDCGSTTTTPRPTKTTQKTTTLPQWALVFLILIVILLVVAATTICAVRIAGPKRIGHAFATLRIPTPAGALKAQKKAEAMLAEQKVKTAALMAGKAAGLAEPPSSIALSIDAGHADKSIAASLIEERKKKMLKSRAAAKLVKSKAGPPKSMEPEMKSIASASKAVGSKGSKASMGSTTQPKRGSKSVVPEMKSVASASKAAAGSTISSKQKGGSKSMILRRSRPTTLERFS